MSGALMCRPTVKWISGQTNIGIDLNDGRAGLKGGRNGWCDMGLWLNILFAKKDVEYLTSVGRVEQKSHVAVFTDPLLVTRGGGVTSLTGILLCHPSVLDPFLFMICWCNQYSAPWLSFKNKVSEKLRNTLFRSTPPQRDA